MNLIRNRRGDKYLSVYWFVILAIVVAGVFGMVYVYYGSPYDIRQIEASVLVNKVADCVSYGGRIDSDLISNGQASQPAEENFLEECNLNFKSEEWEEEQYYTEVNFYKLNDLNDPNLSISFGNNNFVSLCEIQGFQGGGGEFGGAGASGSYESKNEETKTTSDTKTLPKCVRKSFYSIDDSNNQYIIKILSVVRKTEKNVKL